MIFFNILLLIITGASAVAAASAGECKNDVNDIHPAVVALDEKVAAFPSKPTLNDGLVLRQHVVAVQNGFDKANSGCKGTTLSEGDSKAVANSVGNWEQRLVHALLDVIEKKPYINNLGIPGINTVLRAALHQTQQKSDACFVTLIASSANSVKGTLKASQAKIDSAFAKVDKAYS